MATLASPSEHHERKISDVGGACQDLFLKCTAQPQRSSRAELQRQRFHVWASYLGVFASDNAALDKRLEYSDEVRGLVVQLLSLMERNLRFVAYARTSAASGETLVLSRGNETGEIQGTASEALDAVEATIDRLNRLGATIRKYSTADLENRVKAFSKRHGDGDYSRLARQIVHFRYRTAMPSLQDQLAVSMANRRQRLRYIRRHQVKLGTPKTAVSQPKEQAVEARSTIQALRQLSVIHEDSGDNATAGPSQTRQKQLDIRPAQGTFPQRMKASSDTRASGFSPTPTAIVRMQRDERGSVISSLKNSPTFIAEDLESFPGPPKLEESTAPPCCPFCGKPLEESDLKLGRWQASRHVLEDVQPFICISDKCEQASRPFKDFEIWARHMRETHSMKWTQQVHKPIVWRCDVDHAAETFEDEDAFRGHLDTEHSEYTPAQQEAIYRSSKVTRRRARNVCPMCNVDVAAVAAADSTGETMSGVRRSEKLAEFEPLHKLAKHIAGHLRRLAFDSAGNLDAEFDDLSETIMPSTDKNDRKGSKSRPPSGVELLSKVKLDSPKNPGKFLWRIALAKVVRKQRALDLGKDLAGTLIRLIRLKRDFDRDWSVGDLGSLITREFWEPVASDDGAPPPGEAVDWPNTIAVLKDRMDPKLKAELEAEKEIGEDLVLQTMMAYSLWDRAYDNLRKKEPQLVEQYGKLLSKELVRKAEGSLDEADDQIGNANLQERRVQLDTIIKHGLDRVDEKKIKYQIAGHEFVLQDQIAQTAELVVWTKAWIDEAVKASPEASLAWAGVCLILPILMNRRIAEQANRDGFTYVITRMRYYVALEPLLWPKNQDSTATNPVDLMEREAHVVHLYEHILDFQFRSVLRFFRTLLGNLGREFVQDEDWKGMISKVQDLENRVDRQMNTSTPGQVLKKLSEHAKESFDITQKLLSVAEVDAAIERTGSMDDLNRAVKVADMAVASTTQYHPDRAGRLSNLGRWLGRRFERTGSMDDLDRAVEVADMAVAITPQDHPGRAGMLDNLGRWLGRRFERTGSMDDLDRAVYLAGWAGDATPQDHPDRAGRLSNLGSILGNRFERTGSMDDLDRAVYHAGWAVDATPQDHPDRAGRLNNLGYHLGRRFDRTGSMDDLSRAVKVADMAVASTPQDHPNRAAMLNNLGYQLGRRFERTGSMDDLDRAVEVADMAVASTPEAYPGRAAMLNNLGNRLGSRFERTGSMDDLDRAVGVADMAVASTPEDHPDRAAMVSNLASRLGNRFERTGSMDDLDRAVGVADIAGAITPQDHPNRAAMLNGLGNSLGRRFERTGSMDDLDRAVGVADIAVAITPQDHPNRAAMLNGLGNSLGRRFERTGSMDDLDRAVELADMAVDAAPQDHPHRAGMLDNLGRWLGRRFERTGSMDDLDRAVELADMAVDAAPQDHPQRAGMLDNLGRWLGRRFERTGSMDDLDRAVYLAGWAGDATPQDHPDRAGRLSNLGSILGRRFERTGSMDDLDRAVYLAGWAVDGTPPDHPDRAGRLSNLGSILGRRFERTGSMDDLDRALSSYKEGWRCEVAPPSRRIRLAWEAARILTRRLDWDESSQLLEEAVKLLPTVSPRSLQNADKQQMLSDFAGLASMAAATALNAGKEAHHALELLELGRCVIAGLLLEMRTDVSDLEQQHPGLATEFMSLRDELDAFDERMILLASEEHARPHESQAKWRRDAENRFNEVIKEIRTQPGFQSFLHPPTGDELMAAADPDPIVVVNAHSLRCDAFIVDRYQIQVLQLPNLGLEDVKKNTGLLRSGEPSGTWSVLEWLWDVAAGPILDRLGIHQSPLDDNWPHVWWVLAGQLSQLPFHAAGLHVEGYGDTVLDRVISSYSTSVKALLHWRRYSHQELNRGVLENALLIAMEETPGHGVLRFARQEMEALRRLCPSLNLNPITPPPHREDVLAHLRLCKIFHFAGHVKTDPIDPSKNSLLLEDWKDNPLTVADIRDHRLQETSPFLAYLSASLTGATEVEGLAEETIHLISACQLAGFRHVVGALWEVRDDCCVDVATVLYETLRDEGMTDRAIARGLHRAVRALRGRESGNSGGRRNDPDPAVIQAGTHNSVDIDDLRVELQDGNLAALEEALRKGRNFVKCGGSHGTRQESPLSWVPYVHFGVLTEVSKGP
ncbi:hypothetical protein HIM_09768 [Hirsutella minnesotensis 3608]|uniref:CHAT domain-containing protein n=1 Tax=Hirsutella minnesotensis 3608 TaxID=1043627 RepID=A0A0F8A2X8_9HYPO|nr:hypothetical protein HIM_09768 [Hirsutella minnesotensis 3608]